MEVRSDGDDSGAGDDAGEKGMKSWEGEVGGGNKGRREQEEDDSESGERQTR